MRRASLFLAACLTARTEAQAPPDGGPRGVRDLFLLAQSRLSLPATLPDTLPAGKALLRLRLDWGNDFAHDQDGSGEHPRARRFLVDGEHLTLDLEWRRGMGRRWDAGLRLPLQWRGGGVLDAVIDGFHGFTTTLGLPDNDRSQFRRDLFRVQAIDPRMRGLSLDARGAGMGNLELDSRMQLAPRVAFVARVMLPTGSGPFDSDGLGLGLQLALARRHGPTDLAGGLGGSYESDAEVQGFRYERWRSQGFASIDWRLSRRFALIAETTVQSRLVTNIARFPGLAWYLGLGARLNLDSGWTVEGGFTENIKKQQSTTDIGFQLALARR